MNKVDFKKDYKEYLNSDEWKAKRIAKAEEQHYTCERCGKVVLKGFEIHHKTYTNFKHEKLSDLMFLCRECHVDEHCKIRARKNRYRRNAKKCSNCYFSQLMKYRHSITVLYCNLKVQRCDGVCSKYKKGAEKTLPKFKKKKKKTKKTKNNNKKQGYSYDKV